MVRSKLTPEIKGFIDAEITSKRPLNYRELSQAVTQKYGVKISKATISKRAKALKIQFRCGRKRIISVEKKPAHSIFLDCAGAFFLKGAELEIGLLRAINQLLKTRTESARARHALKLAQQINASLLYAPIFGLNTAREIASYLHQGLLYLSTGIDLPIKGRVLTEQRGLPRQNEIEQYLHFLVDHKLLLSITKEVTKICSEVLFLRIDFVVRQAHHPSNHSQRPKEVEGRSRGTVQSFYLDAQTRTVWPSSDIPQHFSATINKTESYVKKIFQFPSAQQPLILQTCPGYAFLPPEMFNLIQCFEQTQTEQITRIVIVSKSGKILSSWQDVQPGQKCFFLAPLSPWQYVKLPGTKIIQDFQQYLIGPEKEPMAVAEAQINLFDSQLNENISLRAALVRRKEEQIALVTNISRREERYIRKIAAHYFCRWPDENLKTYYDLLEEAHEEMLARSRSMHYLTPLITMGYRQKPEEVFRAFLEYLHRYTLSHFFPSEYQAEGLESMGAKFYRQSGYLKIKRNCWEIFLRPFPQKKLQKAAQVACQRFNQMDIKFLSHKINLRIFC